MCKRRQITYKLNLILDYSVCEWFSGVYTSIKYAKRIHNIVHILLADILVLETHKKKKRNKTP